MTSKKNASGRSPAEESSKNRSTRVPKGADHRARSGAKVPDSRSDPPPRKGVFGVKGGPAAPGSKNDSRRCTATAQGTGERCKRAAIKGGNVCTTHGGAAPQVQKSAKQRLMEMVEPAMIELRKIIDRDDTVDSDKLRAIQMVLDRAGYGPGAKLEVEGVLSTFDQVMIDAFGGEVVDGKVVPRYPQGGIDRSALDPPSERPALGRGGGGGESEDLDQLEHDVQAEIDRERYAEEDARIRSTGPVVRGEVVGNDPPDYSRGRGTR